MSKRLELFLFVAILLLAGFLRLYRLDQLPPGLHYDEAFNATQARNVLAGIERPLYFTEDLTEEPMAIYTASVFFALFGASPFSLRLVSAFVGIVTVAALYLLARHLFSSLSAALLSAFVLAILYWHINFSRLGMEPIFLPLVLTLGMGLFWKAFRPLRNSRLTKGRARVRFVLAGLFFALTQYTYKAALFVPMLFAAFLATEILMNRNAIARNLRGLELFCLAAVLAFAPLGLYWAAHPSEFIERPSTVLVTPSQLVNNVIQVSAMFFLRGDENPRSNLPGRAVLDPFLAIGFIVGIVVCLARFKRVESRLMLFWLVAMALPSVFTDFAPHFGRSIGAAPAVALVTGYGFDGVRRTFNTRRTYAVTILLVGLAFSTLSTFRDYFDVWASRTGQFDSFDVGLFSLAQKLRAEPANETIFISPVDANHYTIQFGLNGEARSFDGRRVLALPEPGAAAAYGIITRDDTRSLTRLGKIFPTGRVVETIYDFTAQPFAVIYRAEGPPQIAPQNRVNARVGDAIALIGYDLTRNVNEITLTVYWGSIAETREDYTVFVHLLDSSSQVISQDDARPGHGTMLIPRWRAGQVIVDEYRLVIPLNLPRGEYQIEIGMYDLASGARVRITDANGTRMESDRVLVERLALP